MSGTREETTVRAGIENLIVSEDDEVRVRKIHARSLHDAAGRSRAHAFNHNSGELAVRGAEIEFGPIWHGVRQALLETFAEHDSHSLQHTLYAMGEAVLESFDNIREIHLALPDRHYDLVDLGPFGMDNPAEVFLPDGRATRR